MRRHDPRAKLNGTHTSSRVDTLCGSEDLGITFGHARLRWRCSNTPASTVLDIGNTGRGGQKLLPSKVPLVSRNLLFTIEGTLQVGSRVLDVVLVIQIGEFWTVLA